MNVEIAVDPDLKLLYLCGRPIELTYRQYQIFGSLLRHGPGFVEVSTLVRESRVSTHGAIKRHIVALRRKLGYGIIETRREFGYRLTCPVVAHKREET